MDCVKPCGLLIRERPLAAACCPRPLRWLRPKRPKKAPAVSPDSQQSFFLLDKKESPTSSSSSCSGVCRHFFLQMVFFLACSFFVLEAIGRKVLHPRSVFLVSSVLSRFRSDGARFRFTLSSESDRYKDIWCWHLEIFEPCRKFLRYLLR